MLSFIQQEQIYGHTACESHHNVQEISTCQQNTKAANFEAY